MENRGFGRTCWQIRRGNGEQVAPRIDRCFRQRFPARLPIAADAVPACGQGFRRLPVKSTACYTFAASQDGFEPDRRLRSRQVAAPQAEQVTRVHDPIAASRRIALRAVAVQGLAVALLTAGCLLGWAPRDALAVAIGGMAGALGNAAAAVMALGGGIAPARVAFGRLMLGVVAKWCVAIALFAFALAIWRLPPLPMLLGLAAGTLVYLVALNLLAVKRNTSKGLNA